MQIGRYDFDPQSIVLVQDLPNDEYEVTLPYGVKITLNAEEKAQVDKARSLHSATMYCYGVARAAGLRG